MEYIQEITLDLNANSAYPVVNAKQYDTNTRVILAHFVKDGAEYKVSTNNSVGLRMRKPDKHVIFNNCKVNDDGTVSTTLTEQSLSVAGKSYADFVEFNSNSQVLSTVSFIIDIEPSPNAMNGNAVSSDEFLYLKNFIDQGLYIVGKAQEWANGYNGEIEVSEDNPAYNNHAKYWAEQAANSWEAIQNKGTDIVEDAEAWAKGTRSGIDVSDGDETYQNNAKYWAEQADIIGEGWAGQAEESRQKIENMTVSYETVKSTAEAGVEKTTENDIVNLHFKLPSADAAFITFDIDPTDGKLYMFRPEATDIENKLSFVVNKDGWLEVEYNDN